MKRMMFAGAGAVVGLFVIMMIAASVQGMPMINPPVWEPADVPVPEQTLQSSPMPAASIPPDPTADIVTKIIGFVFFALLIAASAVIVVLIVRALVRAWRDRPLGTRDGIDVGPELDEHLGSTESGDAAPAIQRGIAGALRAIDERPVPTDAIIAAWVGLEESATDAGITRGVSETPAEFTLRIITQRSGITQPARELLRWYERVRFGGYLADENDRDAARVALQHIEEGWR